MEVNVIDKTDNAERLICQAARGDMYSGYIGDTEYAKLMSSVEAGDDAIVNAYKQFAGVEFENGEEPREHFEEEPDDSSIAVEARTQSFIDKQASRGHWGIWEHPSITFAIKGVSRVTMAQITRHRHLSFDVQSMRYVDFDDPDYAMPESLTNPEHFTRGEGMVWDDADDDARKNAKHVYEKAVKNCTIAYESMLELGVPPEDARYALPLATQVNITMSGNARTMLHVLNLRQRGNAQWEIRQLSDQITSELEDWIPYTAGWWEQHGPLQISP